MRLAWEPCNPTDESIVHLFSLFPLLPSLLTLRHRTLAEPSRLSGNQTLPLFPLLSLLISCAMASCTCAIYLDRAGLTLLASLCALSSLLPLPSQGSILFDAIPPFWDRTIISSLSSLFSRYCSLLRSHFQPDTSNFESDHRTRFQLHPPVPHNPVNVYPKSLIWGSPACTACSCPWY